MIKPLDFIPIGLDMVEELINLEKSIFRDAFHPSFYQEHIKKHPHMQIGLILNGSLSGYIVNSVEVDYRINPYGGKFIHILRLGIKPGLRGFKFAAKLVDYICKVGDKANLPIMLEVNTKNKKALSLYKKNHFVVIDELPGYYGKDGDAWVMVRHPQGDENAVRQLYSKTKLG